MRNPEEKKNVRKALASKSLKAGSYSLAVCAIALVIVIVANLIVGTIPGKWTKFDVSSNDLYTLTEHSKDVVRSLKDDVTVYHLTTASNRDARLAELLERYADLNKHIRVEERDPQISQIASKYTTDQLSENSLIFVSGKRSKVVDYDRIMGYSDEMQMYAYYGQQVSPDEFSGEREITGALDYVTKDVLPKIYTLTGHGEYDLASEVESAIAAENIELNELDLMLKKTVPEDCACLLLLSPDTDITDTEKDAVLEYFGKGGSLLVSSMVPAALKGKTPNFDALLSEIGVENGDGFVIEGDTSSFYSYPNYLVPTLESHEITDPIINGKYHVYYPIVREMSVSKSLRGTLDVTVLMHTSDTAFSRTDTENSSAEKAPDDQDGPFNVAFAVTETVGDQTAHAVVFATPYFMDATYAGYAGNINLLLNSLKWMCDLEQTDSVVETKSLNDTGRLEINDSHLFLWGALLIVLLPLAVLVWGIVVFVKRRKR
ncbi:MAG: GldG family protein [Clostridia bacterium]|nr:GldG family protein [Clostridia bacterium]